MQEEDPPEAPPVMEVELEEARDDDMDDKPKEAVEPLPGKKRRRKRGEKNDEQTAVEASLPELERYYATGLNNYATRRSVQIRISGSEVMPYWSRREAAVMRRATPEQPKQQVGECIGCTTCACKQNHIRTGALCALDDLEDR